MLIKIRMILMNISESLIVYLVCTVYVLNVHVCASTHTEYIITTNL